jgi:superoxide dismutase, Fe-Mn family
MSFVLRQLPYAMDALSPYISKETLEYHYGKHHQAYINKLNGLIQETPFAEKDLDSIVKTASGKLFNNAAQVWNHDFYWQGLSPDCEEKPAGDLLLALNDKFGSFDKFKEIFKEQAMANFGSGWTWLVQNSDGSIAIENTSNAGNPITAEKTPLLTCDIWEHAYYIDRRNERGKYIDNFWHIVNWKFVENNFE